MASALPPLKPSRGDATPSASAQRDRSIGSRSSTAASSRTRPRGKVDPNEAKQNAPTPPSEAQRLREEIGELERGSLADARKARKAAELEREVVREQLANVQKQREKAKTKVEALDVAYDEMEKKCAAELSQLEDRLTLTRFTIQKDERDSKKALKTAQETAEALQSRLVGEARARAHALRGDSAVARERFDSLAQEVEQQYAAKLLEANAKYEGQHNTTQQEYEKELAQLKDDLRLAEEVALSELEQRERQLIATLQSDHKQNFAKSKEHHKSVTRETVQLVRNLRDAVENLKQSAASHPAAVDALRKEIAKLQLHSQEKCQRRDWLTAQLRFAARDRMTLATAKARTEVKAAEKLNLQADIHDLSESITLEQGRIADLERDAVDLVDKEQTRMLQADARENESIRQQTSCIDATRRDISFMVNGAAQAARDITQRATQAVAAVNERHVLDDVTIAKLKDELVRTTKQFNATLAAFESRLEEFGIPHPLHAAIARAERRKEEPQESDQDSCSDDGELDALDFLRPIPDIAPEIPAQLVHRPAV